ncbi:MAG: uroporphyrinogen decarboxylase [Puniceicoccaceae bacterium]
MNGYQRIQNALELKPVDRTPVWFMRQAGRYLPEYRALKSKSDFRTMVQTPDLATEVTLQPLRRFPQIDAAILFSDILVIPEAMGMDYDFRESGGISMDWSFRSDRDLSRLDDGAIEERLAYVFQALAQIRMELGDEKALFGFGGSPWTLATYMVEGGSSKEFANIKAMGFERPDLLEQLLELITSALIRYFRRMQQSGVQAIQIFDSWGSACPGICYESWSLKWIRRIIDEVGQSVPFILFSKGMGAHREAWIRTGARVLSLDSSLKLGDFVNQEGRTHAIQGNLDPLLLSMTPEVVRRATRELLDPAGPIPGHIFNLGHGILPHARIESVESMLEAVDAVRGPVSG